MPDYGSGDLAMVFSSRAALCCGCAQSPLNQPVHFPETPLLAFGYKNHIAVDRAYGLIRKWMATHAAAHDGPRLEDVLDQSNTASEVWADTAYRSVKNEAMLSRRGFVSRIYRKKPKGRPMPDCTRILNARKSKVRSAVEHVFAHLKGLEGLHVRTIGISPAKVKIGMANLAYIMRGFVWLSGKYAPA